MGWSERFLVIARDGWVSGGLYNVLHSESISNTYLPIQFVGLGEKRKEERKNIKLEELCKILVCIVM